MEPPSLPLLKKCYTFFRDVPKILYPLFSSGRRFVDLLGVAIRQRVRGVGGVGRHQLVGRFAGIDPRLRKPEARKRSPAAEVENGSWWRKPARRHGSLNATWPFPDRFRLTLFFGQNLNWFIIWFILTFMPTIKRIFLVFAVFNEAICVLLD